MESKTKTKTMPGAHRYREETGSGQRHRGGAMGEEGQKGPPFSCKISTEWRLALTKVLPIRKLRRADLTSFQPKKF